MKARLLIDLPATNSTRVPTVGDMVIAGTIIDIRAAWFYVRLGIAEPLDEECRRAAGMTPEMIAAARTRYERARRGIHPDDNEAFDAGMMIGYDADGEWIPGPNFQDEFYSPDAVMERSGLLIPD